MTSQVQYVSSSGIVADGNYTLLATSSNHYIPIAAWVDKPVDVTVRLYSEPSGTVADNSNTLVTLINSTAGMIYFPQMGVSGVSIEVVNWAAGGINITLFYQNSI